MALTCLRFAQHVSSLAQACFDMTSLPARALLVQPHWCDEILAGRKTWEIRGSSLGVRGRVALAACGTGTSVGEITFVDALPVGRRDEGGTLLAVPGNEIHFMALPENMSKQGVNDLNSIRYRRCSVPAPYWRQFVDLGRPGILRPPAGVLKRPAAESVEEPVKKVAREEVVRRFVTES